uniref:Uncharacterized protein n=1 Tax=Panagrolaimus sp. PS1159 TaxID=55785 RepID=A0AC35ESC6_9BILA
MKPFMASQIISFLSLTIFITNLIQIDGMFLLKNKLAFAPQSTDNQQQQQQQRESIQNGEINEATTKASAKLPFDNINFRKDVEKIYEKWMLERRNQMFDKMKQGVVSQSEAKAFQEILEEYFGDCICEKDSTICRIYGLSC